MLGTAMNASADAGLNLNDKGYIFSSQSLVNVILINASSQNLGTSTYKIHYL
jgi:hypothetical protein